MDDFEGWFQLVQGLAFGACGCALELVVGRKFPSARAMAQWIWPLPVGILLLLVLAEIRSHGISAAFVGFFYRSHQATMWAPSYASWLPIRLGHRSAFLWARDSRAAGAWISPRAAMLKAALRTVAVIVALILVCCAYFIGIWLVGGTL